MVTMVTKAIEMRGYLLLFLLASSESTNNECPPGEECMGLRFCPSEEVETLDRNKFCGDPGFLRYCCSPQIRDFHQEPKELAGQGKLRCSKNSDCPETQLPSGLEVDMLPDVEMYALGLGEFQNC